QTHDSRQDRQAVDQSRTIQQAAAGETTSLAKTRQDKARERHSSFQGQQEGQRCKNVGLQRVLCTAHGRRRSRGRLPTKRHHRLRRRRRRRWGLRRSPWQRYHRRGRRWRGACRWRVRRSSDGGGSDV
ncbi:unnamed protein product, partial [Ectocarpus sp. 12 AP-2014]